MAWLTGLFTNPETATAAYGLIILVVILVVVFGLSRMRHARAGMFIAGGRKQRLAIRQSAATGAGPARFGRTSAFDRRAERSGDRRRHCRRKRRNTKARLASRRIKALQIGGAKAKTRRSGAQGTSGEARAGTGGAGAGGQPRRPCRFRRSRFRCRPPRRDRTPPDPCHRMPDQSSRRPRRTRMPGA